MGLLPQKTSTNPAIPQLHMCALVGPQFGWQGQVSFHKNTTAPHVKMHPTPEGDKTLPQKTKKASVDNWTEGKTGQDSTEEHMQCT